MHDAPGSVLLCLVDVQAHAAMMLVRLVRANPLGTLTAVCFATVSVVVVFGNSFDRVETPSAIGEAPEPHIFERPKPHWIDLGSEELEEVWSHDLLLDLFAELNEDIRPSTVEVRDQFGNDLVENAFFWQGDVRLGRRQLLVASGLPFSPRTYRLRLLYATRDGMKRQSEKQIRLGLIEDFERFSAVWATNPLWQQKDCAPVRDAGNHRLLCRPYGRSKASLVFLVPYEDDVEIEFEFRPMTSTPNVSVSFTQHAAFVIGDGDDRTVRFKRRTASDGLSHEYEDVVARMPSFKVNADYLVSASRSGDAYRLGIEEKGGPKLGELEVLDQRSNPPHADRPYLAFWVFRNSAPGLHHVEAATYFDNIRIRFN